MTDHVRIVGAGAVGLCLAWELSRRGFRVTLMDRGKIGKATSWAGAGLLPAARHEFATDPLDQLRGLSHELFPQWTRTLESVTGIDCGYRVCGGWYLANTPGEAAAMLGMTAYWGELGIQCDPVTPADVASREPSLSRWARGDGSAWWVPEESQVRPPRYLRALATACQQAGVELIEDAHVTDVRPGEFSSDLVVDDRRVSADIIVLCGGAWTGQIAPLLRLQHSIVPVRGQMLLLKTDKPTLRSIVNVGHRYIVCRDDGHTLVGSNEEEAGFQLGTTDVVLDSLHHFATSLVPELVSATRVDAWSGIRPMTFDTFPMIGRVPDTCNLYVAAGHFRSGLHLSPATAVVLADAICGKAPADDLAAFSVGRYQSREPAPSESLSKRDSRDG